MPAAPHNTRLPQTAHLTGGHVAACRAASALQELGETVGLNVREPDNLIPRRTWMVRLTVPGALDVYGTGDQPDTAYFDALNRRDEVLGRREAA